ncbi:MAG: acyl-CoA dehydrogenase family protein [Solirubrobacteraceae bacterium]
MPSNNPSYQESKRVAEESREAEWKQPSFGRGMYLGNFQLGLIHPQPKADPDQVREGEEFLARLRAFLTERVDPLQIEESGKLGDDLITGLKDLGALGMKIPKQYGGLGLTQVYYNRALSLAGTWHAAISTLLSAHQSIGLPEPLKTFGSEEQKQEWLPKVAKDHISAFLLTEPDVGSDPARMSATAVPTEDGSGYRINGTKLWATNGVIADVVVVMAVVQAGRRQGWDHGLHLPDGHRRHHRQAPQRVHGPARHRELGDRVQGRVRPQGERHRGRGQGPEDRPRHAQHGPALASGDLRRGQQVLAAYRPAVGQRAQTVGSAARQA